MFGNDFRLQPTTAKASVQLDALKLHLQIFHSSAHAFFDLESGSGLKMQFQRVDFNWCFRAETDCSGRKWSRQTIHCCHISEPISMHRISLNSQWNFASISSENRVCERRISKQEASPKSVVLTFVLRMFSSFIRSRPRGKPSSLMVPTYQFPFYWVLDKLTPSSTH